MKRGICVHYRSAFAHETCKAGIVFNKEKRLPCILDLAKGETCASYQEPTVEQIEAEIAQMESFSNRLKLLGPILTQVANGERKEFECPMCKGKLTVSRASNGHSRGICSTPSCYNWIE